jgi:peptide/nickel transport system permease protein
MSTALADPRTARGPRSETSKAARAGRYLGRLPVHGKVGLAIVVVFALLAIFGPLIFPFDSVSVHITDRLKAPGSHLSSGGVAWLGTDQVGRNMLPELLAGARVSLAVAFATVLLGGAVGLVLGLLAGYFGGWLDIVISRVGDIQLGFPSVLLAILLAGVLGPSMTNVILVLAVTRWIVYARVVRASVLGVKNLEFVDAARVMGASHARIIGRYVLPSSLQPFAVLATVQVGLMMIAEASLSFLGLGVPVSQASWGSTISAGQNYISTAWWVCAEPGIALALVVVGVGMLGDSLRSMSGGGGAQ